MLSVFHVNEMFRVVDNKHILFADDSSILVAIRYYTIIDFNEVDIRIYLPEKVIIHRGR